MSKKLTEYNFPEDLKEMDMDQLSLLSYEIRDFLINSISKTGGHLASNLGVVELSIALHRSFDSPRDKIIWDVGHQSYVHKILTGRAAGFETLRQDGGMSGFPKSSESPHDTFNTGHSSDSISLATGLAKARDMNGEDYRIVAVIGDGAMTGGLAYEGLNNLGDSGSDALVILNDNGMSISKSTGGLSKHLNKLRVSKRYYSLKKTMKSASKKIPGIGDSIYTGMEKVRDSLKYVLVDGVIFEELGFTYIGPIDGHNIPELLENLKIAKSASGPVLLHIITEKGKGYKNAELHPSHFHGTGPFDPTTGKPSDPSNIPTYSDVFGRKMIEMAENDSRIVAVSAAMINGTGLEPFARVFPERTFDVGIAEGHGVTFAAGLAAGGARPVVAIYSTFLQRAYDNILIDVCLHDLPVVFAVDRAGNVGADGETHHGIFDLSYLSHMPNMTVLAPRDGRELEDMLEYAFSLGRPCAVRYPRGTDGDLEMERTPISEGAQTFSRGTDAEIWAVGNMTETALKVCESLGEKGIDAGVTNVRIVKPLDEKKLLASAAGTKHIITLEDNSVSGGFGERASAFLLEAGMNTKVMLAGWPEKFIEHGSRAHLLEKYGLDPDSLTERICDFIETKT